MSDRCDACGDVYKNYAGLVLHKANCIPNLKLEIADLRGLLDANQRQECDEIKGVEKELTLLREVVKKIANYKEVNLNGVDAASLRWFANEALNKLKERKG